MTRSVPLRFRRPPLCAASLLALSCLSWPAGAQAPAAGAAPPVPAATRPATVAGTATTASANTATHVLTLRQMGAYGPIALRGVDHARRLDIGVRLDEVVTAARLKLAFSYSPALVFPLSHIKLTLNDEVIATLPLEEKEAGRLVTREIDIDPRFFTDFNHLRVQLIAHYTLDHCEDPLHSSLWADISPATTLTLNTSRVTLPDNLALLPAPFFDRRDNRRVTVPFVLPAGADGATLRAAGVAASWLGALAAWREARFPVARTVPAGSDAIAFVTPQTIPAGLNLSAIASPIAGPTVSLMPNPASPDRKLLVVAGRNAQELQTAVNALVLGKAAMAGNSARVESVDIGKPRRPYDAPAWAPTDRPVLFRELVPDPQDLQVAGSNPNPIRVNLRVPADLYDWTRSHVPLNLRYRYTAPPTYNDSVLSIDINDQLVRSYRLRPLASTDDHNVVSVPLLSGTTASASQRVGIPAFRVGSNNQMQFQFHIDSQKTGLCTSTATDVARAAIDPDSTIDFSRFSHYTGLPNLAYFANSGYPFTRLADLADTAVVVPDAPTATDQEALLSLLGHMGKWTGLPSLRVTVVPTTELDSVRDRNLLLIGTGSGAATLEKWGKSLPLLIARGKTEISLRDQRTGVWSNWLAGVREDPVTPVGRAILSADGPVAALVGFESPLADGNTVVALTATEDRRVADVLDALENPGKVAQMRGDLTVIRQDQVDGLRLGERYYVGDLPWYARIWVRVSAFPSLLAIGGLLAGLVVALSLFWTLGRLAARRGGS
ncbi:cellulose biosynthesis cyclic di-GMP-binding regulatory protein BcsB [Cupriavidus oxalaticus]|uniref:Cyclic di-GMP-binding protein n=1 Tax=Cupriavidus oxalaticus TaxID=96344 RepID=A0A375GGX6_9BURK|nr:cellulose biosynthesis cyclic di-GMP-binding regulatory protein BcsB [Cupriavidus oxalaticus]QRQ84112.1 cellulose biosynthesis cyclic di-GMP-binding regulatory protein BcsB [Cupriavidus oxalaticus]QRQ91799.1 cellulose biosynthesis cyclic di-GMP-binding regulatory protein BcsB [Cupriavidus oxalaticus]WQD86389.1 cellulose biosynthesis cyclic di-GMP-binding regulatory protein BcsB [Cupriavidus oxalaticus]SPC17747.1 Cellulose synthase, subunit B [Cupriavidus oxalaticus]